MAEARPEVRGREGRHARRGAIGDGERIEPAHLFAGRAPDRKVAGMQPRHILPGLMGGGHLGDDRVEIERRRVDDARARRAPVEHRLGDQRARKEADRAGCDQVAPAQRDEVGRAGPGADEMDRHAARFMMMTAPARR
jgi:hypothetical protein